MKVPSPGESITEVEIADWLVQNGDYVEKDQAIAEVDSDKATLELPAEASGTITLQAEVGDAIAVGAVVCLIDTEAEKPTGTATTPTVEKKEPPTVFKEETENYATGAPSPAAKKILDENGISVVSVESTGRNGRITKDDALRAVPSAHWRHNPPRTSCLRPTSLPRFCRRCLPCGIPRTPCPRPAAWGHRMKTKGLPPAEPRERTFA